MVTVATVVRFLYRLSRLVLRIVMTTAAAAAKGFSAQFSLDFELIHELKLNYLHPALEI